MKSKNTKHALFMSILSVMLCIAMLIGSTFAWFTDNVTSGKNKIVAGNLDVELEYATAFDDEGNPTAWESVEGKTDLFSIDPVWEPGHTEVVMLKVRNAGSLALKYRLEVEKITETSAYNVDNQTFSLLDYLVFNKTNYIQRKSREAYWNADLEEQVLNDGVKNSNPSFSGLNIPDTTLEAGAEEIFSVAIYMPTSVGNEANWRPGTYFYKTAPYIELGLKLYASQVPHEEDSFGPNYDVDAKYDWDGKSETAFENLDIDETAMTVSVKNAEDLVGALKNISKLSGYTVKLDNSVNLNNQKWTSRSASNIMLDGQGNTISGLNGTGGLFSSATGTIKNLKLEGVVNGSFNVAGLVNTSYGELLVEDCIVDVDVTDVSSDGTNVGGIIATNKDTRSTITIRNCVYKGNVTGKIAGGIIGFINTSKGIILENNTNEGTVTSPNYNAGGIAGHIMNANPPITGTIRGCINKGTVTAKNSAGGILGYTTVTGWAIVDCTNTGSVTGTTAGGILGGTNVTGVVIENCQNSGTVTGNSGGGSV